jgi:hypothetical protein
MRRHWKPYKPGDERTREFFAWWPVTIRQEHAAETRWLERVKVLEMFQEFKSCDRFWPKRFLDNAPLYLQPQPTLTEEEKDAVMLAYHQMRIIHADNAAATLRGLLERLGGAR